MKKSTFFSLLLFLGLSSTVLSQGCMTPSSSSGPQVIGYLQSEYSYQWLGNDDSGNSKDKGSFYFRRARLGVTGNIPYDFSYYVLGEFNTFNKGAYLQDAFITYNRFKPYLKISMGQFKVPFGLELSSPCQGLHTIDRSRVVNELASPFRDQGIFISGSTDTLKLLGLTKTNLISWSLAITNGTGLNADDNNTSKDMIGRLVISPFDWISLGGSYHFGKQKNPDITVTKPDEKSRWGVDLELKKWNFTLQSEFIDGKDVGSKTIGGGCGGSPTVIPGTFKSNGLYSQLMYRIGKFEPVIKFETYDPDKNVDDADAANFRKSAWTAGLNFFPNDWTRLQVNYVLNQETENAINKNEISNNGLFIQLQVLFN